MKFLLWEKLVEEVQKTSPLEIVYKKGHALSRSISVIGFWMDYMRAFTTRWPRILIPDVELEKQRDPRPLQHELVHFWDQETFFGLLKFMPRRFNSFLFFPVWVLS